MDQLQYSKFSYYCQAFSTIITHGINNFQAPHCSYIVDTTPTIGTQKGYVLLADYVFSLVGFLLFRLTFTGKNVILSIQCERDSVDPFGATLSFFYVV